MKTVGGPVLDVCWSDDATKVFIASCDKQVKCWDLGSDQVMQVAQHDAAIKTCHWVKSNTYNCLMTGSWDKTLKVSAPAIAQILLNIEIKHCFISFGTPDRRNQ